MKIVLIGEWLGFLLMSGCNATVQMVGYEPKQTIRDEKTGYYVELARTDTMLDVGFAVHVFKDAGTRSRLLRSWKPVFSTFTSDVTLSFHDGCYQIEVDRQDRSIPTLIWKDPDSEKTICFDVVTRPRPRLSLRQ